MTRALLYCPACDDYRDPAQGLFSCPASGDGGEHILDPRTEDAPGLPDAVLDAWKAPGATPLEAFAALGATASLAGAKRYARLAAALNEGLARHEGASLAVSPLMPATGLASAMGHAGLIAVKDETGQPGGSHKVRHLAGTMLYLETLRETLRGGGERRPLAISSCGNAALAAACVARASGYSLTAFVPEDVSPVVASMLAERGAEVRVTPRLATGGGDPCYLAFREAVAAGAAPFCCSGRDNWSAVEGGKSLGFEAALQWRELHGHPDHLVLQIGGGVLGRSVATAFEDLRRLGLIPGLPRIHACQPEGGYPFVRAWLTLLAAIAREAGIALPAPDSLDAVRRILSEDGRAVDDAVEYARANFGGVAVTRALALAAREPSRFMRPWDGPAPSSLAHGILDDETYDWYYLARSLLLTGGRCVLLPERTIAAAHGLALAHTPVNASPTGTAGLAGLLALKEAGAVAPADSVGLFLTGINR